MRFITLFLLFLHGLIHVMGFLKGFRLAEIGQLSQNISRPYGLLWLLAAILFVASALLYWSGRGWWVWVALVAILISQFLIIVFWKDASYGTLANLIIGLAAIIALSLQGFEKNYAQDVRQAFPTNASGGGIVTEADIQDLPLPVQGYLRYTGAVGKPRVQNMRILFKGEMREKGKEWFNFSSEQYNFTTPPARFFFMKAKLKGIPTWGYHDYSGDGAGMLIKIAGLIPVVNLEDPQLFPTETVTFFNDLCLFAPGALIDERIVWEPLDSLSARATFSNQGTSIKATLYFNENGQLTNFVSEDRVEVSQMKTLPFSTPLGDYGDYSGMRLPAYGEAVWQYPEGEFTYGRFKVMSVQYNLNGLVENRIP